MSHQEDTLRGHRHYNANPQTDIRQHGAEELANDPNRDDAYDDARKQPEKQQQNREHMGVNDEHKTDTMEQGHRGTFP